MAESPRGERRFNDEEVALIIKRAAELQQTEQTEQEAGSSLSLTEVEQIAREAGIDPGLIRRAAFGLEQPSQSSRPSIWLGSTTHLVFERVVDGEIPIDEFEPLIAEVRRALGENGMPSVLGRSLAWTSGMTGRRHAQGRHIDVSVVVRGGFTTIRVEEELRQLAGALFGGIVGGGGGGSTGAVMGIGMGVFHSFPIAALMWVSVVGGAYALARTIFGRKVENRERQLRELADRLEEQVADAVTRPAIAPASGSARALPGVTAERDEPA